MSTMTKVFIVLTTVLSIALSCLFVAAAARWENWRDLADKYQEQRDAAITHAQNTSARMLAEVTQKDIQIDGLNRDLAARQADNERITSELASLRTELSEVKNERLAFEAGRAKLQEILDVTTTELKAVRAQNQTFLAQNRDLQTRNGSLSSRVLELTTTVSILQDESRNVQEKLAACERGASERISAASTPGGDSGAGVAAVAPEDQIRGQVVEVTDQYASVDVGETSGVSPGMTFLVYRPSAGYIGDLVIERVRPNQAGGRLSTLVRGNVLPGDEVVLGQR